VHGRSEEHKQRKATTSIGSAPLAQTRLDRLRLRHVDDHLSEHRVAVNPGVGEAGAVMQSENNKDVNPLGIEYNGREPAWLFAAHTAAN